MPANSLNSFRLLLAAFAAAWMIALPAFAAATCAEQSAAVDEKFKFTTYLGTFKVSEADPDKLCKANFNAFLDKRTGQNSLDDSSYCRSTWVRLSNAVNDYKQKVQAACEKTQTLAAGCTAKVEDPRAAFVCLKQKSAEAAKAEREAAAAMDTAARIAAELRKETDRVRNQYVKDEKAIKDATAAAIAERERILSGKELISEDAKKARLAVIDDLLQNASGVSDGRLAKVNLLERGTNSNNGGQSTLTGYSSNLKSTSDREGLIIEQTWAADAAKNFQASAESERNRRIEAASKLEQYGGNAGNDFRPDGNARPPSTISAPPTAVGSLLSNANSLAGLATAGAGLASVMNRQNTAASSAIDPNAGMISGGPQAGAAAPAGPAVSSFGAGAPPGKSGTAPMASPSDSTGKTGSREAQITSFPHLGGGHLSSGKGDLSATGDLSGHSASSAAHGASSGEAGKDGIKEGRSLAGKEDKSGGCSGSEGDCSALADLKTPQFNAGGAFGMPKIGAADPGLSTKGALDSLFGPLPALDSMIPKPADPTKGNSLLDGLIAPFEAAVGVSDTGGVIASGAEVAPANSRSLFARVHDVHENAQKRGTVSLYHKKL